MSNYYTKELEIINKGNNNFTPSIKIYGTDGVNTKHISLNQESAKALIEWLEKNYINKP